MQSEERCIKSRLHKLLLLHGQVLTFWSSLLVTRKTSSTVPSSDEDMLADTTFSPRLLSAAVRRSSRLCWSGPVMVTTVASGSVLLSKSMNKPLPKSIDAATSKDVAASDHLCPWTIARTGQDQIPKIILLFLALIPNVLALEFCLYFFCMFLEVGHLQSVGLYSTEYLPPFYCHYKSSGDLSRPSKNQIFFRQPSKYLAGQSNSPLTLSPQDM